jgi:hypothetical protein
MVNAIRTQMSCGVVEIYNLDSPKQTSRATRLDEFLKTYRTYRQGGDRVSGPLFPIVIFSDNVENAWGEQLKEDINNRGDLGVARSTVAVKNENTGRDIKLFFWKPSQEYKAKVKLETKKGAY